MRKGLVPVAFVAHSCFLISSAHGEKVELSAVRNDLINLVYTNDYLRGSNSNRELTWTENATTSSSCSFWFMLGGSIAAVSACYVINSNCGPQRHVEDPATVGEDIEKVVIEASLVDCEEKFHARVQEVAAAIQRPLVDIKTVRKAPRSGVYSGTKNAVDLSVTLLFTPSAQPAGYIVEGFGKDSVGDTQIVIGFMNDLGELYYMEERQRKGGDAESCAIKYTSGTYNFLTDEFKGWFESSGGLRGPCHLSLQSSLDVVEEKKKIEKADRTRRRGGKRGNRLLRPSTHLVALETPLMDEEVVRQCHSSELAVLDRQVHTMEEDVIVPIAPRLARMLRRSGTSENPIIQLDQRDKRRSSLMSPAA